MTTLPTNGRLISPRVLRAWWAMRSQKRRRHSSPGAEPAAPVITSAWSEWNATEAGWVDVMFSYTFQLGSFPVAYLEVWMAKASGGWVYNLLDTIVSVEADDYYHIRASATEETFRYKMRYRNGGLLGPFSNEVEVFVT